MSNNDHQLPTLPLTFREPRRSSATQLIANAVAKANQPSGFGVILVCALALVGCTATTPRLQPTTEYVPVSSIRTARGGSQTYYLSPRERLANEKRAAEGDIAAAKTLVEYYEMVTKNEREYQRWRALVVRLQKAQDVRRD